jgi:hypothetical protein
MIPHHDNPATHPHAHRHPHPHLPLHSVFCFGRHPNCPEVKMFAYFAWFVVKNRFLSLFVAMVLVDLSPLSVKNLR